MNKSLLLLSYSSFMGRGVAMFWYGIQFVRNASEKSGAFLFLCGVGETGKRSGLRNRNLRVRLPDSIRGNDEIGKHAGLKNLCFGLWVRCPFPTLKENNSDEDRRLFAKQIVCNSIWFDSNFFRYTEGSASGDAINLENWDGYCKVGVSILSLPPMGEYSGQVRWSVKPNSMRIVTSLPHN